MHLPKSLAGREICLHRLLRLNVDDEASELFPRIRRLQTRTVNGTGKGTGLPQGRVAFVCNPRSPEPDHCFSPLLKRFDPASGDPPTIERNVGIGLFP